MSEEQEGGSPTQDFLPSQFCPRYGLFLTGGSNGVARNLEQAFVWYMKAAEAGSARGMHNVGSSFAAGGGVPRDYDKALKYFKMAYEHGYELAGLDVAEICAEGFCGFTITDAIERYQSMATSVNEEVAARAKFHLSYYYEHGTGVERDPERAGQLLKEASLNWEVDPQIIIDLGVYYESKDRFVEAVECYQKGASKGQRVALFNLAICVKKGLGIPRDEAKSAALLREAAELGDADSMYEVGKREERNKNTAAARLWFEKAFEGFLEEATVNNVARSYYKLGKMSLKGRGRDAPDEEECIKYLRQGCSGNFASVDCMLLLGRLYALGATGCFAADDNEAFRLVKQAADLELPNALYHLAIFYKDGVGCEASAEKSRQLLEEAAAKRSTRAVLDLANVLLEENQTERAVALLNNLTRPPFCGSASVKAMARLGFLLRDVNVQINGLPYAQRQEDALRLLTEAGSNGDKQAFFEAARMHSEGIGTVASGETAVKMYEQGWKQWRSPEAARCLGTIFLEGLGVPEDKPKAVQYYYQAAAEGDCDAMFNLACCFDHGVGCERNVEEAVSWYRKTADDFDDREAAASLVAVYSEKGDLDNVFKYAKKLCAAGDAAMRPVLIDCYVYGKGTLEDHEEARRLGWDGLKRREQDKEESGLSLAEREEESEPVGRGKRDRADGVQDIVLELEDATAATVPPPASSAPPQQYQTPPKSVETPPLQHLQQAESASKRAKTAEQTTPLRPRSPTALRSPSTAANVVPRRVPLPHLASPLVPPAPQAPSAPRSSLAAAREAKPMRLWTIDEVAAHFEELGCDAHHVQQLRQQKIDGEALEFFGDWRMLRDELKLPTGVCVKHESFAKRQRKE